MPTISQLTYVVAVDRLRHFGKAAEACHVSQPSLSMQIQKIEEKFDLLLFDRKKKPILPTPQGEQFIAQAKVVLREHQKLLELAEEKFNPLSGQFRLGVIPTLAPYVLPLFIKEFTTDYPDVELLIDELKTEDIISALQEDELDAALLSTPLREKGLKERPLFYEPFYCYTSPGHPLSQQAKVDSEKLQPEDLWLLQEGHCFKNQVTNYCEFRESVGKKRGLQFKGGNFETLRLILQKAEGYTLFPKLFVDSLPASERKRSVRAFKSPQPAREISLVHRRDQWKKEILKELESTLKAQLPSDLKKTPASSLVVLPIQPQ